MAVNPLYELLDNRGLLAGDRVCHQAVKQLTFCEIIDIAQESAELATVANITPCRDGVTHSATLSLGGGRRPCAGLSCRLDRVSQLAQFSALYSDCVYIHNFLSDHISYAEHFDDSDEAWHKREFLSDIIVLSKLRPLIDAGRVVITAPTYGCGNCWLRSVLDDDARYELAKASGRLCRELLESVEMTFLKVGSEYFVECRGPESLLEHGFLAEHYLNAPPGLGQMPRIMRRVENGDALVLSRHAKTRLGLHKSFVAQMIKTIAFEMATAQQSGTALLTDHPGQVAILNSLHKTNRRDRTNDIVLKHLTSLVPFLENVKISDILKLRANEGDAFLQFRAAMNDAVAEYQNHVEGFDTKDAQSLFADVIAPKLARIEQKLRSAQRTFVRNALSKSIASFASIAFGVYAGLLPNEFIALTGATATALGTVKAVGDVAESVLSYGNVAESIKGEELYFLWDVRRCSRKFRRL